MSAPKSGSAVDDRTAQNPEERKDVTEAILEKFERMAEQMDDSQFHFVVKYIFSREFRVKVYEEKELAEVLDQEGVQKEEINQKFGCPDNAKLIWNFLSKERRDALALLAAMYPL